MLITRLVENKKLYSKSTKLVSLGAAISACTPAPVVVGQDVDPCIYPTFLAFNGAKVCCVATLATAGNEQEVVTIKITQVTAVLNLFSWSMCKQASKHTKIDRRLLGTSLILRKKLSHIKLQVITGEYTCATSWNGHECMSNVSRVVNSQSNCQSQQNTASCVNVGAPKLKAPSNINLLTVCNVKYE